MVTGASVDGLVSGMQTSSVIAGLMQVEAAPQTALKQKVSTQTKVVSAYQTINTKMSSLLSAAKALNDPTAWKSAAATSSSDTVLATSTTTGANQSGQVSFRVKSLAAAESHVFDTKVSAMTDVITSASQIVLTNPDTGVATDPLTITDKSLKGVVDAINNSTTLGVRATAIQTEPGKYQLQLTSTTTGEANFAVSGIDGLGAEQQVVKGSNAKLEIGDATPPLTVTSASNKFSGIMEGLTVTAKAVTKDTDPPVTVTVASDSDGIAAKVQALVDAANAALTEIGGQTKNATGGVAGGVLAGNSSMQGLSSRISGTVAAGAGVLGSLKSVGIELARDGSLKFDKATFTSAFNADPVKTQSYFNGTGDLDSDGVKDGFADKMVSMPTRPPRPTPARSPSSSRAATARSRT